LDHFWIATAENLGRSRFVLTRHLMPDPEEKLTPADPDDLARSARLRAEIRGAQALA